MIAIVRVAKYIAASLKWKKYLRDKRNCPQRDDKSNLLGKNLEIRYSTTRKNSNLVYSTTNSSKYKSLLACVPLLKITIRQKIKTSCYFAFKKYIGVKAK